MEDEQQSTPTNATSQWYGEGVDQGFADQLKAARQRYRMSQGRVADRMREDFGLPWHQTTVAKTESGTRPLLFREAVALAKLLHLDLGLALAPTPSAAEKWVAEQRSEIELTERAAKNAENAAHKFRRDLLKLKSGVSLVNAVLRFNKEEKVRALIEDLVQVLAVDNFAAQNAGRVLDLLGLPVGVSERAYREGKVWSKMANFGINRDQAMQETEGGYGERDPELFPVIMAIELASEVARVGHVDFTPGDVAFCNSLIETAWARASEKFGLNPKIPTLPPHYPTGGTVNS